jgi:hypothetical protein
MQPSKTLLKPMKSITKIRRPGKALSALAGAVAVFVTSAGGAMASFAPPSDTDTNVVQINAALQQISGTYTKEGELRSVVNASSSELLKAVNALISGSLGSLPGTQFDKATSLVGTVALVRDNAVSSTVKGILTTFADTSWAVTLTATAVERAPAYASNVAGDVVDFLVKSGTVATALADDVLTAAIDEGGSAQAAKAANKVFGKLKTSGSFLLGQSVNAIATNSTISTADLPFVFQQAAKGAGGKTNLVNMASIMGTVDDSGALTTEEKVRVFALTYAGVWELGNTPLDNAFLLASESSETDAAIVAADAARTNKKNQLTATAKQNALGALISGTPSLVVEYTVASSLAESGDAKIYVNRAGALGSGTTSQADFTDILEQVATAFPKVAKDIAKEGILGWKVGGGSESVAKDFVTAIVTAAPGSTTDIMKNVLSGTTTIASGTATKLGIITQVIQDSPEEVARIANGATAATKTTIEAGVFLDAIYAQVGATDGYAEATAGAMVGSSKIAALGGTFYTALPSISGSAAAQQSILRAHTMTKNVFDDSKGDNKAAEQFLRLATGSSAAALDYARAALVASKKDSFATEIMGAYIGVVSTGTVYGADTDTVRDLALRLYGAKKTAGINAAYAAAGDALQYDGEANNGYLANALYYRTRMTGNQKVAADILVGALGANWTQSAWAAYGVAKGSPKETSKITAAFIRNLNLSWRDEAGQFDAGGWDSQAIGSYTHLSSATNLKTQNQTVAAAAGVSAVISGMKLGLGTTGTAAKIIAEVKKQVGNAVKEATKAALAEHKTKLYDGDEHAQVRGAVGGGLIGIDTSMTKTDLDDFVKNIAVAAVKAAPTYAHDIAGALGEVLGSRNAGGENHTGTFVDLGGVDWASFIATAMTTAGVTLSQDVFGNAIGAPSLEAAFDEGFAIGQSTQRTTKGTLAWLANTSVNPVGTPVTDISGH